MDTLRVIRPAWPREPRTVDVVADLASATSGVYPVRGSLAFTPGQLSGPDVRSGARSAGSRTVDGIASNGSVSVEILVVGATTVDAALATWDRVAAAFGDPTGLELEWRAEGATRSTYFDLRGPAVVGNEYAWVEIASAKCVRLTVAFPVGPWGLGRPMDFADPCDTVDANAWTIDEGGATVTAAAGVWTATVVNHRLRLTGPGYAYRDFQLTAKITGPVSAPTALNLGRTDAAGADTGISARMEAGNLRIVKRVAGVNTNLAVAVQAWSAATPYWIRFRSEGRVIYAEAFTAPPTPLATPLASTSYVQTDAEFVQFRDGHPSIRWVPTAATEQLDDVTVEAFAYRQVPTPDTVVLDGVVPGTAAALVDVAVTTSGAGTIGGASAGTGGEDYPVWGMLGVERRSFVGNYIDGRFEDDVPGGWTGAAITGVNVAGGTPTSGGAAGSKFGVGSLSVATTATANAGAARKVPGRFRAGATLVAFAWFKQSTAAATVRIRVKAATGDTTDRQTPTVTTSATWQLVGLAATFTAQSDGVYVQALQPAAVAETFLVDGFVATEPIAVATLGAAITTATQTAITLAAPVPEVADSASRYVLLIDTATGLSEIARGTIAGTTLTLERGIEGQALATLAIGASIYILDVTDRQVRGAGAAPAIGFLPAVCADSVTTVAPVYIADATSTDGSCVRATTAGAGTAQLRVGVDASTLTSDAFRETVDVAVYARFEIDGRVVTPQARLSARAYGNPVSRYTAEYGATFKLLPDPGGAVSTFRTVFLGTVTMTSGKLDGSSRWFLTVDLAWAAASVGAIGVGELYLVPRLARAGGPERKPLDTTYPKWVEATTETTRIIRSDGSGLYRVGLRPAGQHHGLGGSALEVDPGAGRARLIVKLASMAPEDQTASLTDSEWGRHVAAVQASVRPRYRLGRGG